jgi:His/Glu/Gln/Arg/opine family amino acid ABC transporter permease subunit
MRRSPWLIVLLGLAALLTTELTARAADHALARVRARGELVIATDATYPPFEYVENDKLIGFDIALAEEVAKELGVRSKPVTMEWSGVFAALETGKCDLVWSGVTITAERKKGNAFTRPYFLSGQVLVRRKGDPIRTPEELIKDGKTVAVQQETTGQFAMEKRGMPKDRIHRFDTLQDALLDVRNGKSDAAVGDLPPLAAMIRKGYPELEVVPGGPFVEENLGIVARRDARDLVAAINTALDRIMADGRYSRLYTEWMKQPATLAMLAKLKAVEGDGTTIPPEIQAKAIAALSANAPASPVPTDAPATGGSALSIRPEVLKASLPALLAGARLTIGLTIGTLLLGVPLGLLLALARSSSIPVLPTLAAVYVEVVRGTPLLMQIFVIYFVLPAAGVSLSPIVAGLTALSLNAAAYCSEIFRAGIESIDSGQREAARALGMSGGQAMRFVILPQTLRRVLPPLTNEAVALLKDSSLVSAVSVSELMRVGKEVATTAGAPTTIYLAVALIYLALTLPLTFLVRYLENRWQPVSRPRVRPTRATGKG